MTLLTWCGTESHPVRSELLLSQSDVSSTLDSNKKSSERDPTIVFSVEVSFWLVRNIVTFWSTSDNTPNESFVLNTIENYLKNDRLEYFYTNK